MIDRVRPELYCAKSHDQILRAPSEGVESSGLGAGPPWITGVVVVIPALNEADSLPLVLADLPPRVHVIVVDNGSTDATAEVARRFRATVVHEPVRGYGSACLRGLSYLETAIRAGDCPEPRVVAFLDADYSDHPELLPMLVEPVLSGQAEFVVGSRMRGHREAGAMPPQAVFGNWLACLLMRVIFRTSCSDLGPFRAIDYASLRQLDMRDRGFGWTVEMQIKAARRKLRFLEIPVPYRCRVGKSKISGTLLGTVGAGYKILYLIGKHALLACRLPSKMTVKPE